eukprot:4417325-Prorocentrum_lima.AAC.1
MWQKPPVCLKFLRRKRPQPSDDVTEAGEAKVAQDEAGAVTSHHPPNKTKHTNTKMAAALVLPSLTKPGTWRSSIAASVLPSLTNPDAEPHQSMGAALFLPSLTNPGTWRSSAGSRALSGRPRPH